MKFWWFPEGSYNILDTDYDNYAVIYGCDNFFWGNFHIEQAWLLNRYRKDKNQHEYIAKAIEVFAEKVPTYHWHDKRVTTQHDDQCIYYPFIQKIIDQQEGNGE